MNSEIKSSVSVKSKILTTKEIFESEFPELAVKLVPYSIPKDAKFKIEVIADKSTQRLQCGRVDLLNTKDEIYDSLEDVEYAIRDLVSSNMVDIKGGGNKTDMNKSVVSRSNKNCKIYDFTILINGEKSPLKVWFSFRHSLNESHYGIKNMPLNDKTFSILYPVKIYVPDMIPE